jgi:mRNA interferase YafQ
LNLRPVYSGQFKRDLRQAERRGKDIGKLKQLIVLLLERRPLVESYRDHPLKGSWSSFRDVHIEPDWLLIYKVEGDTIRFERTGRHTDLFDE